MKKNIFILSLFLVSGIFIAQTLPTTENYVETRTYLDPVSTSSPGAKQVHTVQYFDGLGRPKQVVNVKASPQGKDVVTPIEYDGFGRQVKDYLPVPQSGTQNGAIYSAPLANATNIYGGEKIYAEKILENSPLDRLQQQIQVGTDWATHPVQFAYETNTATEVKMFVTTTTWSNNATLSQLNISGNYPANQLYKNKVTDEDGNVSIEFKNGQGQTLLVRKVLSATENADTYYVYNEYDQLAFVIPPLAAIKPTLSPTDLDQLCYQYRYDGRNRLVEKKLPGKGWEWMVYDKQDRLTLTKDVQNPWLFTKYDPFSRVVYTGIYNGNENRSSLQNILDSFTGSLAPNNEIRSGSFNAGSIQIYYTKRAFPTTNFQVLSVNYYDTYPTGSPTLPTTILGQEVLSQDAQASAISTKSLPTASYVKNIEDDQWTKNYTWYDKKGRAIGSHSINHLGGYTKTESELDFAGVVKQSNIHHKRLDGGSETVIHEEFTYDPQNRLLLHKHQVNSQPMVVLTENIYNERSQLDQKKVGNNLQTIDYKYNIRGWMLSVNNPYNLGDRLFAYNIKYNNPDGYNNGKYNGNIAQIDWKSFNGAFPTLQRYSYFYDSLNRLTNGVYKTIDVASPQDDWFTERMGYDLNGNILRLNRFGAPKIPPTAMLIDNLFYTYNGNQLTKVFDKSQNNNGYPFVVTPNPIDYDYNGNMKNHFDKGIKEISYNFLNLPVKISPILSKGFTTTYLYRADGVKVKKSYKNMIGSKETDYLDGFQYEMNTANGVSSVLKFVPTAEGYYNFENSQYVYNYVDHLGNVRVSYYKNPTTGSADVLEKSDYYPFGLKHDYGFQPTANPSYNYKYNGKELQETGMYDYGARFYMPDIGRFGTIDPRSQYTHEAYSYVWNNPIFFNDPTGMEGEGLAHCPTCPDTAEFKPYIDDKENVYVYDRETNTASLKVTPIEEVTITKFVPTKTGAPSGLMLTGAPNSKQLFAPAIPAAFEVFAWLASAYTAWKASEAIVNADLPTRRGELADDEIDALLNPRPLVIFPNETDEDLDINGVPVPVDDSGYKKPVDQRLEKGDNKFDFAKKRGSEKWGDEAEHKKGTRRSTRKRHEEGQTRKGRDKGGEKGDKRRPFRNK